MADYRLKACDAARFETSIITMKFSTAIARRALRRLLTARTLPIFSHRVEHILGRIHQHVRDHVLVILEELIGPEQTGRECRFRQRNHRDFPLALNVEHQFATGESNGEDRARGVRVRAGYFINPYIFRQRFRRDLDSFLRFGASDQMLPVALVFRTYAFDEVCIRRQRSACRHRPWLVVGFGIVERDFEIQVSEVAAAAERSVMRRDSVCGCPAKSSGDRSLKPVADSTTSVSPSQCPTE